MLVLNVKAKLGLYSGAVNAEGVQALTSPPGELHVLLATVRVDRERHLKMHAGHGLCVRELPDVDVVAAHNAGQGLDVFANIGNADVFGRCLQKDPRRSLGKRDGGLKDNGSDEEGDGRIGVVFARPLGQPDDQSRYDDTKVAESIANDVEDHGVHAHIAMAVTMTTRLAGLAREGVIVTVVNTRIPATAALSRRKGTLATAGSLGVHSTIGALGILEQRRLLIRALVMSSTGAVLIGIGVTVGLRATRGGKADDILAETGRMNAHVLDAGKT